VISMGNARETSSAQSAGTERARQPPNGVAESDPFVELQQSAGNQALLRLLAGGAQRKPKLSQPGDDSEQQADLIAEHITRHPSGLMVQRKCAACAVGAPCSECAPEEENETMQFKRTGLMVQRAAREGTEGGQPATQTAAPQPKAGPSLIVEDNAKDLSPGQMRKTEFISQLRTAACNAAEQALAGTMWSAMGCPYIERWLGHYSKQSSVHLERALRKYVPESASVRTAQEYLPLVTQKLRRGIEQWRTTGEAPADLPAEFTSGEMPGMTVSGLVGGLLSGVGSAISGLVSGVGSAIAGVGRMLFKEKDGHEPGGGNAENPQTIRAELGGGHPLEGGVRQRMQSAFGADFSGVRVHSGFAAQEASDRLEARAFTIGTDIAFGPGEYQPGTPVGDALIAHELAHVVQQQSSDVDGAPMAKGEAQSSALEEEADVSAVGAVVSTLGGAKRLFGDISKNSLPRLRSGLRLQRCSSKYSKSDLQKKVDGAISETEVLTFINNLKGDERKQAIKDLEDLRIDYVTREVFPDAVLIMEKALQNIYRDIAQKQAPGKTSPEGGYKKAGVAPPPELLTGTAALDAAKKAEAKSVLTPVPSGGVLPTFHPNVVGKGDYEPRIRARVRDWIDTMHTALVAGKGPAEHADPTKVFPMDRFKEIGNAAKEETDKVFGSHARGPVFTSGVNLIDQFEDEEAANVALAAVAGGLQGKAKRKVAYIINTDEEILKINKEHGAVPSRTTPPPVGGDSEATILNRVKSDFAASDETNLLEIDRNWEGAQLEGQVFLQRFKKTSDLKNRRMFWDTFQIMIHEYVHSLENEDYHNYAKSFPGAEDSEQYNTLVEGMASVLAEIAWTNVAPHVSDQSLRDKVESVPLAAAPFNSTTVPEFSNRRYPSFDQAMKLVNVVGIKNVYAAFFLGKTDLIGK
jgi:hypothetical protein